MPLSGWFCSESLEERAKYAELGLEFCFDFEGMVGNPMCVASLYFIFEV